MVVIVTKMGTSSFTLKLQIPSGERGKRRRRGWSTVNCPMTILYPAGGFSQRSLTLFPATRVLWGGLAQWYRKGNHYQAQGPSPCQPASANSQR